MLSHIVPDLLSLDRFISRVNPTLLTAASAGNTPALWVDLDRVAANFDEFTAAFPTVEPFFAMKANPALPLVRRLVSAGCRFDVASVAEALAALSCGADVSHLSYGNTVKKLSDIRAAAALGVDMFAFDADTELDKLMLAAPGSLVFARLACDGRSADVPLAAKFGTSPEHALDMLVRAGRAGHRLGVSFHTGSQQTDPSAWEEPIAAALEIAGALADEGFGLDLLNLGGGFASDYLTSSSPGMCAYAAAINPAVRSVAARVIAEPGRFLVASAALLAAEVVAVTERPGAGRWVYLDTGVFGGLAETLGEAIRYPIVVIGADNTDLVPVTLAGPTCDSADVMYKAHPLARDVKAGDRVLVLNAGSYTFSYASVCFNGFEPPQMRFLGR